MTPTAPLTLEAAPEIAAIREALPVVAHATTDWMRSITETELALIPNTLSNKGRRDRCRALYRIPLVTLSDAQSALTAQAATIAQLEARLREAIRAATERAAKLCEDAEGWGWPHTEVGCDFAAAIRASSGKGEA